MLQKITQLLLPLVAGAALVYLLIIACAFLFQSRLIYFPERELAATPRVKGLSYQAVVFKAADGSSCTAGSSRRLQPEEWSYFAMGMQATSRIAWNPSSCFTSWV